MMTLLSLSRPSIGLLTVALLVMGSAAAHSQSFASSVVSFSNLNTDPSYTDPTAALGQPTTIANDGYGDIYHDSLVVSAYGTDPQGNNLLVSLGSTGLGSLTVKFDQAPITHSSSHWYGDDFIVYSNEFFKADQYADVDTDMTQVHLTDGSTAGTLPTVSVSSDGINFTTLTPADSILFPENPYKWVGISTQNPSGWDDSSLQDFSKPVDPVLTAADFAGQSAAYAANTLYDGSAGGTAFSLAGTAFAATGIQYVRFTGYGTIDGVSRVSDAPAAVPEASSLVSFGLLVMLGLGVVTAQRRRKSAV
ncbi:MAG: hypothetical protein ACRYFS_23990 [Janthinobacterium lividum]